jgi:isoleucyl-tRNA synthetase
VIADNADYLEGLGEFSGKNAKKHPELIIDYLKVTEGGRFLLKSMGFTHRYPACWRCKTELVWKVADEWYIAMDTLDPTDEQKRTLRQQMKDVAHQITWMPDFGLDRELDWLTNMHDWLISKPNRYWGLALPIYECQKCGTFEVIGSKEELQQRAVSGWETFAGHTPHKPWIDAVKIKCSKCGATVTRLPDVGNVWLDAGIVPFSTLVDPKTGKLSYTTDKSYWQRWYPADFITESFPGQFKNWFYSLIAMATVLERTPPFKTVLGFGTLLGEDGRPMHKSWGNSIEFNEGAEKIGADVMRWMYCTHDPAQNMLFGYKKADETRRRFHLLLWNVYNFFITYASIDQWSPSLKTIDSTHVLDRWILSRLNNTTDEVTERLDTFDVYKAATEIEQLVNDLSLWYVRGSRNRVGPAVKQENFTDRHACYTTLYTVLVQLCKMLAPFVPFMAEEMYKNLTGKESVHVSNWPKAKIKEINVHLEEQMSLGRELVTVGNSLRKELKLKTRQPLARAWRQEATKKIDDSNVLDEVLRELNIKHWICEKEAEEFKSTAGIVNKEINGMTLYLDTTISPELKMEGQVRELLRHVQGLRKEKGYRIQDRIVLTLPNEYKTINERWLAEIKHETLADTIQWGTEFSISTG